MRSRPRDIFATVRIQGAILPPEMLKRIADGDRSLPGIAAESYHLQSGERQSEVTSRSWQRLQAAWMNFRAARDGLPEGDRGTTITRGRWLLVLFQELGYGRLQTATAVEIEGKTYAISHKWEHVPFDFVGCNVPIDKREAGVAGAARMNPHGLVQELLNRSDDFLWGFVSNGLTLRLLRDNISLSRQAYVEFDLEAMMEGEVYADFRLLWLLCHESRLEGARPEECLLEKWSQVAQESGIRALDQLRDGVKAAIIVLGNGFLAHPDNTALRDSLYRGEFLAQDYFRELLRLVYRLLFLFTAEDRDLLLLSIDSTDGPTREARIAARKRYAEYFSTARLREMAVRYGGRRHADLLQGLRLVMDALASDEGNRTLALPPLASYLFSRAALARLADCALFNTGLLDAVRALAFTRDGYVLRPIDFGNLGAEELGSVYEALLELHPEINLEGPSFELTIAAGNERKTTGSYYTASSLVDCLLVSSCINQHNIV